MLGKAAVWPLQSVQKNTLSSSFGQSGVQDCFAFCSAVIGAVRRAQAIVTPAYRPLVHQSAPQPRDERHDGHDGQGVG